MLPRILSAKRAVRRRPECECTAESPSPQDLEVPLEGEMFLEKCIAENFSIEGHDTFSVASVISALKVCCIGHGVKLKILDKRMRYLNDPARLIIQIGRNGTLFKAVVLIEDKSIVFTTLPS